MRINKRRFDKIYPKLLGGWNMVWDLVREQFPDKLVLVEALSTTSMNIIRTVEEMTIISTFDDNTSVWNGYKKTHKENPEKEIYVFHNSKVRPEVVEKFFIGF
jgi:hypothetical protein